MYTYPLKYPLTYPAYTPYLTLYAPLLYTYTIHPLMFTYTLHTYIHTPRYTHLTLTIHPLYICTDRRLLMTSYNLDTSDPLLLAEYLYHEMVAMGIRLELGHCVYVYIVWCI